MTIAAQPMLGYFLLALAAAVFIVAVLLLAVSRRRRGGETVVPEDADQQEPEAPTNRSEPSLDAAHTPDATSVARGLLDEVVALLGVEFAAVAQISEEGQEATGLVARADGEDVGWWRSVRIDLANEPSAIASAAFEAAPLMIFDVESSPRVNRRLADRVGAKSAAFVPVISGSRVLAVVVAASTSRRRAFPPQELAQLQALTGETALALERTRSAAQLEEALERERLVAAIARKVRSEQDVEALLTIAVEEVGKRTGVSRCFIRLGEPGKRMPIRAEWDAPGIRPIGEAAPNLPVANLAVQRRRTVACGDVEHDPDLEDPDLGRVETLLRLDTKAVLATPIQVFDEVIGIFGLHKQETTVWTPAEIALVEAVAREVGLALHTARLLAENRRRLDRQAALVQAAQVMTSELEVETVLQRLVVEVTKLLEADAADCYLYDSRRGVLRCAAVYGLPAELLEFEFPAETALAGEAMRRRQAVVSGEYEVEVEGPHPAYEGFSGAMVAPMTWWGEVRGVIGVGTNDPDRRFSPEDVEVLEAFASLGSVALRNVASIEQGTRQVRIQRGFFRIASVLAQPLSLDETLNAVAQAATEALGGTAAAVLMPRQRNLTLAGSYELPEDVAEFLRKGLGEADPLLEAALRKRVIASPQLNADDRFGDDWRKLAEAGFQSLMAVPIEAPRSEQTGVGLVLFSEEQAFADDEIELAHHLAGAARGALERAELYEGERRNRAIAQQLARTGTLLASELDPDAILEEIVAQAPGLVGADAAAVSVLEGDELLVNAVYGAGTEAVLGSRVSAVGELAGEVVQSRRPLAVSDAREDGFVSRSDPLLEAGYAAYLGAPLLGPEGGVHGVLAVYAREPRTWREEEVEALGALAGNVSAFLSNAELYQRVVLERERSMAILGNVADGIVAVDREGAVVLWNAAAEEITGVLAAEAMGRTPADVLQRSFEPDETSAEGRGLIQVRRGEEEVWLSVSEAVMRDPAGAVAGRIYAFRDVSSDRLVEQLKTGFVSTVSHELRAPLTSIYGFAETLLREDVAFGDEERRTFLGYIASEAQRLTGIVDALLSVARLEAGDLQVQIAPTDLRDVVSDVVETVEREGANGRQFVVDVPEEPLAASADREKVRQILINLVDNAVKFSPDGGTVTVAARRTRDVVQVRVVDEGSGVPQSEQERIFRKFYRAEASTPAPGGTGLGLFIARGLASAMGGRVWVDSELGPGGCFVFELPSVATEAAETGV